MTEPRAYEYDVVVAGSGLAGLVAAAKAASVGARVGVVSLSPGNLALWSGLVSRTSAGERPLSRPAAEAVRFFVDEAEAAGLPFRGSRRGTAAAGGLELLSPAGRKVEAALAPATMTGGDLGRLNRLGRGRLLVVGFSELGDYPAALIAGQARKEVDLEVDHKTLSLGSDSARGQISRVASLFDDESWFGAFLEATRRVIGSDRGAVAKAHPLAAVAFPPVLGLFRFRENLAALEAILGCPVFELPALPPSLPGQRFWRLWRRRLETKAAVRFHLGRRLVEASVEGGRCLWLGDGLSRYRALAFVLATGGVAGGGLVVSPEAFFDLLRDGGVEAPREPLLGLSTAGQGQDWSTWGVCTGRDGRPASVENVFVAGWQLGASDALGSIASGWLAGAGGAAEAAGRTRRRGGAPK